MEMTTSNSLGDRMKVYEGVNKAYLVPSLPLIIRVDGKSFHTYTRGLLRPFDANFEHVMNLVAVSLCNEVQGAVMAYVQSDEISVLLYGYRRHTSQVWFEGKVQKMASVAAAVAAAEFTANSGLLWEGDIRTAYFDGRVFALPRHEAVNYFCGRQQDATRNSIQSLAQSLYSHSELHGKNQATLQEMCFQRGRNWNDLPTGQRRGRCVVKDPFKKVGDPKWVVDKELPIFSQSPGYVNDLLVIEDESAERSLSVSV